MSKVITFSRTFPAYHPKAGAPTYFVEKFLRSMKVLNYWENFYENNKHLSGETLSAFRVNYYYPVVGEKHHTIRAGNRFKVGDKFSPRVWGTDINPISGRSGPYHSKQIIIAPDIEIKKVFNIKIEVSGNFYTTYIDGKNVSQEVMKVVALNDGLTLDELYNWFNKSFEGQVICWDETINY